MDQGSAPERSQEARDQGPVEDEQGRTQGSRRPSQLAARLTFHDETLKQRARTRGPSAFLCPLLPSAFSIGTELALRAGWAVEESSAGASGSSATVIGAPALLVRPAATQRHIGAT